MSVKRFGQVIGVKPEAYDEYVKAHAAVWPSILAKIAECNIRNYSIYALSLIHISEPTRPY